MIQYFQTIKKIGCYEHLQHDSTALKPFDKVNIFYGTNGSGKTTLSNILYLLSKHCKQKEVLHGELFDETSELEIKTSSGKITQKNIQDQSLDLFVFNTKFVSDHVYNGNAANLIAFGGEVKLTNPAIEGIETRIASVSNRINKISKWLNDIQTVADRIYDSYNKEFQNQVQGSRLLKVQPSITQGPSGDVNSLQEDLRLLYQEHFHKRESERTLERLQALNARVNSLIEICPDPLSLDQHLQKTAGGTARDQVSTKIKELRDLVYHKHADQAIGDLDDWFRKGGRLLSLTKNIQSECPLCESPIADIDSLLSHYTEYFTDSFLELLSFLDEYVVRIEPMGTSNGLLQVLEIATTITEPCASMGITLPSLKFSDHMQQNLQSDVLRLLQVITDKRKLPNAILTFDLNNYPAITAYDHTIKAFKKLATQLIDEAINRLQARTLAEIIREIKNVITSLCAAELNLVSNTVISPCRRTNAVLADICLQLKARLDSELKSAHMEKAEAIAQLKAESKYINLYLKHFGITHFEIDRDSSKSDNNLLIQYKSGQTKRTLQHSLSEGEKTALAFAYFISKLRVEKIEGQTDGLKDSIIVIDDPISSLDDNRLFQTANLIDAFLFFNGKNAQHPQQIFLFSHSITFTKYVYNALRTNDSIKNHLNEYYLCTEEPRLAKLPLSLKNFTNTYLIKLRAIIDFKEKKHAYEVVKNYLPNYIRVVLETFLAFKLAMVNDSHDRLPGMAALINAMVVEIQQIQDMEIHGINKERAIQRLHHLRKVADHESHGSIYRAQEFSFISEAELREFAKFTMQVIQFIDALHFRKVKSLA